MDESVRPLTLGEWMLTLLVLAIPLVNILMYLYWAFAGRNLNRKRFCQASLIWFLIVLGLGLVLGILGALFSLGMSM
jgi:hypothetical protein